jgi:hypothetical protein
MFLKRWVLLLGGLLDGSELTVWRADLGIMLTNGLSGTTATPAYFGCGSLFLV